MGSTTLCRQGLASQRLIYKAFCERREGRRDELKAVTTSRGSEFTAGSLLTSCLYTRSIPNGC